MATFTNERICHIVMLCYYKDQLTNIIINEWKQVKILHQCKQILMLLFMIF
jgi:hypothetical protein